MLADKSLFAYCCIVLLAILTSCAESQPKSPEEELIAYISGTGGEWIAPIGAIQFDQNGSFEAEKLRKLTPAALDKIRAISVSRLGIKVAPDLSFLPSLRRLSLSLNNIMDIKAISALSLERIDLSYNPLADINPLSTCKQLESIGLAGTLVASLPDFSELTKLKQLALAGTPLQSLANLERIRSDFDLNLLGCNKLSNIDALRTARVNTLTIDENNYERLKPWFDAHVVQIKANRPKFKIQLQLLSGE